MCNGGPDAFAHNGWRAWLPGPDDGGTHWSTRRLARKLGTTHMAVVRVWTRYGLQPHRLRHHLVSDDAHFETKAADIIGL